MSGSPASNTRIALIDALRGLAASVVAFHHVMVLFPSFVSERSPLRPLAELVSELNVEAVLLFFVLSGFSIRLSLKQLDMRSREGINEYLYRRFRRIVPLYMFALMVSGAIASSVAPARPSSMAWTTLLGNLAFLQTGAQIPGSWFEPFAENGPLWSLSYEMFYYLMYPLVLQLSSGRHRLGAVLAASAIGLVVQQVAPNPIANFLSSSLVWYLGVELAEQYLNRRASVPVWCFSVLALAIGGVLAIRASATLRSILIGLVLFYAGSALIALARRGWKLPTALHRTVIEPLAFVGSFSFGLYLLHYPVLRAAARELPSSVGVALGVGVAILLAYIVEMQAVKARIVWLRRRYI